MLDVAGIRGDDAVDFPGAPEYGGVGGAAGEDSGGPIEEAVTIADEIGEGTEDRVEFEAGGGLGGWTEEEDLDEEIKEG